MDCNFGKVNTSRNEAKMSFRINMGFLELTRNEHFLLTKVARVIWSQEKLKVIL